MFDYEGCPFLVFLDPDLFESVRFFQHSLSRCPFLPQYQHFVLVSDAALTPPTRGGSRTTLGTTLGTISMPLILLLLAAAIAC